MKIDPPDGFKIPEKPEPREPDQVSGPQSSEFQAKIDQTDAAGKIKESARASNISNARGSRSDELRELLRDLDLKRPDELEIATDRMVEWVLTDSFGAEVVKTKGAEALRAAIREQLSSDPNEAARLQSIFDRL